MYSVDKIVLKCSGCFQVGTSAWKHPAAQASSIAGMKMCLHCVCMSALNSAFSFAMMLAKLTSVRARILAAVVMVVVSPMFGVFSRRSPPSSERPNCVASQLCSIDLCRRQAVRPLLRSSSCAASISVDGKRCARAHLGPRP